MVFIQKGMGVRIPRLSIGIDGDGKLSSDLSLEVKLEVWPLWLDLGTEHALSAIESRAQLAEMAATASGEEKAALLEAECKAGMVAIAAAAFSLDAFYAVVKSMCPIPDSLVAAWKGNGASRHVWVRGTLQRAFRVSNQHAAGSRKLIRDVYRSRGWAVHPPAEFSTPMMHDILGVGIEWRFVAFGAPNARNAIAGVASALEMYLRAPRPGDQVFTDWCADALTRSEARLLRARELSS